MPSIWESTNLRECRQSRLLAEMCSEWSVMKEAEPAHCGRRLSCGIVVLSRDQLNSAQTCWTKIIPLSWKRALIILKNLNIFSVVSPNFDPLAREEMQSVGRCKGECDILLGESISWSCSPDFPTPITIKSNLHSISIVLPFYTFLSIVF